MAATAWEMTKPAAYGPFHLTFTAVGVFLCILIAHKLRHVSERGNQIVLFSVGMFLAVTEIYKQLFYTFYLEDHTYNFGTTGLFFAIGKEKVIPVVKGNEIVHQKHMGFGLVSDERFCDGLYFANSLRELRKIMRNPAILEKPLDKKVEDVK